MGSSMPPSCRSRYRNAADRLRLLKEVLLAHRTSRGETKIGLSAVACLSPRP